MHGFKKNQVTCSKRSPTDEGDEQAQLQEGEAEPTLGVPVSQRARKMSVHEIWNFIEQAREVGVSLEKLAEIRQREQHGGIQAKTTNHWCTKMLSLYRQRSQLSFYMVNKLCMVTDAATHNCMDFLVSAFYTCGQGTEASAYATAQFVNKAKHLYPNQMDLTAEAEVLAARRQVDRLAALKFLQAVHAQVKHISGGRLDLTSFEPRGDLALFLRPLREGDRRYFDGKNHVLHVLEHPEPIVVAIDDGVVASAPILKVIMDQGKTGTAAAAFLAARSALIKFDYDKVHRLVRDLKNGMSWEQKQMLLSTTYWFGINYKPFGAGGFFDEKRSALTLFLESNGPVPRLNFSISHLSND